MRYFSNKALLNKVPLAFLINGIIIIVLNSIGLLLMFEKEDNQNNLLINNAEINESQNNDENTSEYQTNENEKDEETKPALTLLQAIKTPEIYMITVMTSFYFIGPTNLNIYYKVYFKLKK